MQDSENRGERLPTRSLMIPTKVGRVPKATPTMDGPKWVGPSGPRAQVGQGQSGAWDQVGPAQVDPGSNWALGPDHEVAWNLAKLLTDLGVRVYTI